MNQESLSAKSAESQMNVDEMLDHINSMVQGGPGAGSSVDQKKLQAELDKTDFVPTAPESMQAVGINPVYVEELILKYLMAVGEANGRDTAQQIRLPFNFVGPLLSQLKHDQLIAYTGQAALNDYISRLTEKGMDRAKRLTSISTYFGSTPVSLKEYYDSVKRQSIEGQFPTPDKLKESFSDLLINQKMFRRLGPAISSGRGMFLFGFPGNGKTSIAERISKSFGPFIWIPRAITVEGEVIRVFDPMVHEEAPLESGSGFMDISNIDQRWVRIKRPTIVVGGELTMDHLEVTFNPESGISEAPLQLKSNCGVLVIDDFGRQKMRIDELLNRWIVPLEKRYDFLNLASGKKFQVPFDQLVIFSTNLEPRDLVDDAFMRRIPYKIEVENPSREEFTKLFEIMAKVYRIPFEIKAVEYLIEQHYLPTSRPYRNCQPRDILLQIRNFCRYNQMPVTMTKESIDFAVDNYFSVM